MSLDDLQTGLLKLFGVAAVLVAVVVAVLYVAALKALDGWPVP